MRAVLFEAPCIMVSRGSVRFVIDREKCTGCGACILRLGCPAISIPAPAAGGTAAVETGAATPKAAIDGSLCTGCGICGELCAFGAIGPDGEAA